MVAAVPPRLCMIGFTYAQPFLISRAIDLMLEPRNTMSNNEGYGLIAATALIYLGIAVCTQFHLTGPFLLQTDFESAL